MLCDYQNVTQYGQIYNDSFLHSSLFFNYVVMTKSFF